MAHLLTSHDPFHLHALCGLACLAHFAWRLWLLVTVGSAFPAASGDARWGHRRLDTAAVLLHAALHASSFRFDLPRARNFTKPMIWREFRMHSAVFGLRHVACTLAHWWLPAWWVAWGGNLVFALLASDAAAWVTRRFGDPDKRTTNAMPYPSTATPTDVLRTKRFYVAAQMGATACAVWGPPTLAFLPLLAIELAPLMMTLVRKGKASAMAYHRVYALALLLNYPAWAVVAATSLAASASASVSWVVPFVVTATLAPRLRLHARWSGRWAWGTGVAVSLWVREVTEYGWTTRDALPRWLERVVCVYVSFGAVMTLLACWGLLWLVHARRTNPIG